MYLLRSPVQNGLLSQSHASRTKKAEKTATTYGKGIGPHEPSSTRIGFEQVAHMGSKSRADRPKKIAAAFLTAADG